MGNYIGWWTIIERCWTIICSLLQCFPHTISKSYNFFSICLIYIPLFERINLILVYHGSKIKLYRTITRWHRKCTEMKSAIIGPAKLVHLLRFQWKRTLRTDKKLQMLIWCDIRKLKTIFNISSRNWHSI